MPIDCFYYGLPGMSLYEIRVNLSSENFPAREFFAEMDVQNTFIYRSVM